MSASKLERLLNLTAALLDTPRPLTAEQLRQRVPGYPSDAVAFHRAFERDKDDLRELGIPLRRERVVVESREVDGYRVPPEDYYLRDPGLAPDELAALHLAAQVVRLEGATEALWKLGGEDRDPFGGRSVGAGDGSAEEDDVGEAPLVEVPTDPRLPALFAALVDRHPVAFRYPGAAVRGGTQAAAGPGGAAGEERVVDPHRLDFQRGRWYLSGHDHGRDAGRSFRVDRIAGDVEVRAGDTFERPVQPHPGVRLQPWELGSEPQVVGRLLVDAEQAPWAVHHVGADAVEERRPDGSVVLTLPVVNLDAFRSFVLTFLDHAEVLGPPVLRADLVDWLTGIAADGPAAAADAGGGGAGS